MHEPRLFYPQRSTKAQFDQEGRRSWLPFEVKPELAPEFIKKNLNLPKKDLSAAGVRVIALPESKIFHTVR